MAKKKTLLGHLLSWLLGIVITVAVVVIGLYAFLKIQYDVSLFTAISSLRALNNPVNESTLYPHRYTDEDMAAAMTNLNSSSYNLVNYSEEDGYTIGTELAGPMTSDMLISGEQMGAVLNTILKNQAEAPAIDLGSTKLGIELTQIAFYDVVENQADVNVVIKLDLTSLKSTMTKFPISIIRNRIPDKLYISITSTVKKGTEKFDYTVTFKNIKLNNLSAKQTNEIIKILNIVTKCGDVEQLGNQFGSVFVNALIGNADNNGFAYSLKALGATDYNFVLVNDNAYFVIKNLL